jgi:phage shock protein A
MAIGNKNITLINALKQIREGTVAEILLTPELQEKINKMGASITNIIETMSTDDERINAFNELTKAFQQADGTLQGALTRLVEKATTALGEETVARKAAVDTLVGEITDLEARVSDISKSLTDAINSEAKVREAADAKLLKGVDSLIESTANLEERLNRGFKDFTQQIAEVKDSVAQVDKRVDTVVSSVKETNSRIESLAEELKTSDNAQNKAIVEVGNRVSDLDNKLDNAIASQQKADKEITDSLLELGKKVDANAEKSAKANQATSNKVDEVKSQIDKVITVSLEKVAKDISAVGTKVDEAAAQAKEADVELNRRIDAILAKPTDMILADMIGIIDGRNFEFALPGNCDTTRPYYIQWNGVEIYQGEDYDVTKDPYVVETVGTPDPKDKFKVRFYPKSV